MTSTEKNVGGEEFRAFTRIKIVSDRIIGSFAFR